MNCWAACLLMQWRRPKCSCAALRLCGPTVFRPLATLLHWVITGFCRDLITCRGRLTQPMALNAAWILPVSESVLKLTVDLQAEAAEGCPYIFVPGWRWKFIAKRRSEGTWRDEGSLVNNPNRRLETLR